MSDQTNDPRPNVWQRTVDCRRCNKTLIANSPENEFKIKCDKCGYEGAYTRLDVKTDQPQI